MKVLLTIISKFWTPEIIGKLIAKLIAILLRRASKTKQWDRIRSIISTVAKALALFDDVYADDEMTPDEEEQVAQKIESVMGD